MPNPGSPGRLILVPNTLDHGTGFDGPLDAVLPAAVIARAASITHWVVEDARSARAFLNRVAALVPLAKPIQMQAISELPRAVKGGHRGATQAAAEPIDALLEPARQGHPLGLLSEAGLAALADPGTNLVAAAHAAGITVESLPGPSSIALAVAASGMEGQSFTFVGYLPIGEPQRSRRIAALEAQSATDRTPRVAIEAPYRNRALWQALIATLSPTTLLGVACGLTLPDGVVITRPVARWRASQPFEFARDYPAVFTWLAEAASRDSRSHPGSRQQQTKPDAHDVGREVQPRRRP